MSEKKIVLGSIEGAKELVCAAQGCDFEVDVCANQSVLDAKSFLSIFSLDLRSSMKIVFEGYNENLNRVLKKYAV